MPRRLLASLLLFVLAVCGSGPVSAWAEEDGAAAASASVHIRWEDGLAAWGKAVEDALGPAQALVRERLGLEVPGPVEIVVVADHPGMVRATRADVPTWAVGVALSGRGLIVLRADLLVRGWGGGVGPTLRHEWVHLAWGRHAGPLRRRLPLWAEEGIAEEVGGGVSVDAGARLDVAVAFDQLLSLDSLHDRFPAEAVRADLAYKQSRSWVAFFVRERGWPELRRVLAATLAPGGEPQADRAFGAALREVTGLSLGEWYARWRAWLDEETPPWPLVVFRDVSTALLMALALLGLVAFFFVLRRRRRQIASLPDGAGGGD